ncbi:hypothetical protein B566_EDAN006650, partial [Ephemera danica]
MSHTLQHEPEADVNGVGKCWLLSFNVDFPRFLETTQRSECIMNKEKVRRSKMRPPRVSGLQDLTIRPKQKLKLTCHYEGNPLPLIEWYRRGRRIEPSRRARINTRRRKSVLAITRTTRNDTGRYECRAVSVTDERASIAANVSVSPEIEPEN